MDLDEDAWQWTLPADTRSVARARDLVAQAVGESTVRDDVVLAISELVTNAVLHGAGAVDVALARTQDMVRIQVGSASTGGTPEVRRPSPADPDGRGLAVVEALASQWGWEQAAGRLVVWAVFDRG